MQIYKQTFGKCVLLQEYTLLLLFTSSNI